MALLRYTYKKYKLTQDDDKSFWENFLNVFRAVVDDWVWPTGEDPREKLFYALGNAMALAQMNKKLGIPAEDEQGFVNNVMAWLPAWLRLSGYKYCGPQEDDSPEMYHFPQPKNPLDQMCLEHDLAYKHHKDEKERGRADLLLATQSAQVLTDPKSTEDEIKLAMAISLTMLMKAKDTFKFR